jgi:predicted MFS family arabinose efflux permease
MDDQKFLLRISLLSIFFIQMVIDTITPALNDVARAFPDVDPRAIQQLSPISALFIVIFTIVSGVLANRINRKALIYLGCAVELVAGGMQFFAVNYNMMLYGRCLLGCGIGLLAPFAAGALVGEFFQGKEYHQMMGWGNASNNLGGLFTTFFAGILCTINWHYTFLIHGIALLCIILTAWGIPELKIPAIDSARIEEKLWNKLKLHPYIWFAALGGAMGMFCQLQFAVNISMVLAADGLGDAAVAGCMLTVSTLGSIFGSMLYSRWRHILKNYIPVFAVACQMANFIIAYNAHSVWIFFLATTFGGFGMGIMVPHVFARASGKVKPESVGFAFSIMTVGINVGILLSVTILSMKLGPALLGVGFGRPMWLLAAGLLCIDLLYWLAGTIFFDRQEKQALKKA